MLFGLGKSYFFGIDFGTSAIKAVEFALENGKPKLINYGQIDLAGLEKGNVPDGHTYDEEVVLYLKALLKKFQPQSDGASVAMPAFIGLISLIDFPEMDEKDLQEAIQYEAHKYIPSSLDDVALSWEIVGLQPAAEEDGVGQMEILLVAALKKEVARYRKYIEDTGLKMNFLELETFSLVRSLIGRKPGLFLVIDIGSRASNLVLVDDGLVKMSRNLDAGGKEITRTLSESLNITPERAEALKKSGKDFLNLPESALVFPTLQTISSETERMLASYKAKYPNKECEGVILSGGTGQFTGLAEYYARILDLPVALGNPWERVEVDGAARADVEELGTSFSVALGLAMSGIDALTKKQDPMKKSFSFKKMLNKKM